MRFGENPCAFLTISPNDNYTFGTTALKNNEMHYALVAPGNENPCVLLGFLVRFNAPPSIFNVATLKRVAR